MKSRTKRFLIYLVLISLINLHESFVSFATLRVVLLTSLVLDRGNLSEENFAIHQNLIDDGEIALGLAFKSFFEKEGFIADHIVKADQSDLRTALHTPDNVSVFWLSHGSPDGIQSIAPDGRMTSAGAIVNYQGFDVSRIFESFHPRIQYISVISCRSAKILRTIVQKQTDSRPIWKLFPVKIDPLTGLEEAMKDGLTQISNCAKSNPLNYPSPSHPSKYSLKIIRTTPHNPDLIYPAVRAEIGGKEVGMFPLAAPGNKQVIEVTIPRDNPLNRSSLKVVLTAGESFFQKQNFLLGAFEISAQWDPTETHLWKFFSGGNNDFVNISDFVFQYKGGLPSKTQPLLIDNSVRRSDENE